MKKIELIDMKLHEFYAFYDLVVAYSITRLSMKPTAPFPNANGDILYAPTADQYKPADANKGFEDMDDDDDSLCAICFEKGIQVVLPCSHGFCDSCCKSWYEEKQKNECPMCRKLMEGDWQTKSFRVVDENDGEASERDKFVNFVNKKVLFLKLR